LEKKFPIEKASRNRIGNQTFYSPRQQPDSNLVFFNNQMIKSSEELQNGNTKE